MPSPVTMIFPELSCETQLSSQAQLELTSPFLSDPYDADEEDNFSDYDQAANEATTPTTNQLDNILALDLATDVEIDVFAQNHYAHVTAMDNEELERYTKLFISAPSTRVYQRGLGDDDSCCTDTEHSDSDDGKLVSAKPVTVKKQPKFYIKGHVASSDDLPTVPSTTPSEGAPPTNTRFVIQGVQKELDKLVKLGKLQLVQEIQDQHERVDTPQTPKTPDTPKTPATPATPSMTTSNSVSSIDSLLLTPTRSSTDLVSEAETGQLGLGLIFEDEDALIVVSPKNQNKVISHTASPAPATTTTTTTTLSDAWSTFELVKRPMPAREWPNHWKPSMGIPKPKTTHSQIAGIFARGFHALRTEEDSKTSTMDAITGSKATATDTGMWHVPESARWSYPRGNDNACDDA